MNKQEYNACDLSAKISCHNMSVLSSVYTNNQNKLFSDTINIEDCKRYHAYHTDIENIKNNESELLKGFSINKKNCIYKRPTYNMGEWSDQFQYSDLFADQFNSYKLFDYQSKSKSTKEPILCDYSKVLIEEECTKGPYFTYPQTFKSDYYNCLS